jgi:hypothetical protein
VLRLQFDRHSCVKELDIYSHPFSGIKPAFNFSESSKTFEVGLAHFLGPCGHCSFALRGMISTKAKAFRAEDSGSRK